MYQNMTVDCIASLSIHFIEKTDNFILRYNIFFLIYVNDGFIYAHKVIFEFLKIMYLFKQIINYHNFHSSQSFTYFHNISSSRLLHKILNIDYSFQFRVHSQFIHIHLSSKYCSL